MAAVLLSRIMEGSNLRIYFYVKSKVEKSMRLVLGDPRSRPGDRDLGTSSVFESRS